MRCFEKFEPDRESFDAYLEMASHGTCPHTRSIVTVGDKIGLQIVFGFTGCCHRRQDHLGQNFCSKAGELLIGIQVARTIDDHYPFGYHLGVICEGKDGALIEPDEAMIYVPHYHKYTRDIVKDFYFKIRLSDSIRSVETISLKFETRSEGKSEEVIWKSESEELNVRR